MDEDGPAVEESLKRDPVGSAPRVSCEDSPGIRPVKPGKSDGKTVTGFPEDKNPGDMDLECPETFPDEDEWKSPPRTQSQTPEDSRPGDSGEFHSGEERETGFSKLSGGLSPDH